jgi:parallel beta-helix repeat protein
MELVRKTNKIGYIINKQLISLFCALFFLTLTTSYAQAGTYYVSTGGSDSNNGTSVGTAFLKIQKCINTMVAGDTCFVRGGTYSESVTINKQGNSVSSITLKNYQNETPIISGGITLTNADYWVIDGITVQGSSSYGIYSDGSDNITYKNCEVDHPLDGGIINRNSTNVVVDNCNVHHTNWRGDGSHEAISMVNVNGFEVRNNQVHDSKEEGIDAKYGARNGKIYNNVVYGNGGPNIYIDAASNIDIFNNNVYGATGDKANIGLAVEVNSNNYSTDNIKIYNNIMRDSKGGVSFWVEAGAEGYASFDGTQIFNNLFYRNISRGAIRYGGFSNYATNSQIKNNIFKGNSSTIDVTGTAGIDHNLFDTSPKGTNAITTSSFGFADEVGFDFHLNSNSPAVNAGVSVTTVTTDFDGNSRPSGSAYDIGPYEYVTGGGVNPTVPPTTPPTVPPTLPPTIPPTIPPTAPPTTPPVKLGDANDDNIVDGADYIVWLSNYNKALFGHTNADFNNSSKIDGADYIIWLNNYGR